jgi:hypothetical protein
MTESDVQQPASRVQFPGISPRAYEHPADRGAMATLRTVPGVGNVLKTLNSLFNERAERLMAVASHVRVGPAQYPTIDRLRLESAEVLDLPKTPKLYVARDPRAIAQTRGIDEPFIVLSTGLVEALDTEALRFVVGHEMGHVLSGHAVLLTLLDRLLRLQRSVAWVPLGVIGLRAVIAALHEWQRKSELSCDRAGLLAGQDPQAALRATASSSCSRWRASRTRSRSCGPRSCSGGPRPTSTARSSPATTGAATPRRRPTR